MKFMKVKLSELSPCEYNPRRITANALKLLSGSIRLHTKSLDGWDPALGYRLTTTITVNREGCRIVGGHQRVRALQEVLEQDWIHESDITWVRLEPGSPQEKGLNVALNSEDAAGNWEWKQVASILEELQDVGELELAAMSEETWSPLLAADWQPPPIDPATFDPPEPPKNGKPIQVTKEQREAFDKMRLTMDPDKERSEGDVLLEVCVGWVK